MKRGEKSKSEKERTERDREGAKVGKTATMRCWWRTTVAMAVAKLSRAMMTRIKQQRCSRLHE